MRKRGGPAAVAHVHARAEARRSPTGLHAAFAVLRVMTACRATTAAGNPCPFPDHLGRSLCHLHDPDGTWARQHPKARRKLLARPDVQAILVEAGGRTAAHCLTCMCTT
jgi:hypothetical protein